MLSKIRSHRPSHAVVVAYLALFLALGSSSIAAPVRDAARKLITGKQVKNGSLSEKDLSRAARARLRGAAGPQGPAGQKGNTGGVDTSNFYDKAASDSRFVNLEEKAFDSDLLDGMESADFLGASAKAADADKLDNHDSLDFKNRCGPRGGFNTVYIGGGTCLATTRDTFTAPWYATQTFCTNNHDHGRMATYDELIRGANSYSIPLVVGTWTADSAGDGNAIFINSTTSTDADGVAARSSNQAGSVCAYEAMNALGHP